MFMELDEAVKSLVIMFTLFYDIRENYKYNSSTQCVKGQSVFFKITHEKQII